MRIIVSIDQFNISGVSLSEVMGTEPEISNQITNRDR
jgi:hypothetical protein